MSMNLGIGLGGVVGGLIATTADPGGFTRMFLLDAANGFALRTYIPYGRDWFPYFDARLAERPANLAFFTRNFFRSFACERRFRQRGGIAA